MRCGPVRRGRGGEQAGQGFTSPPGPLGPVPVTGGRTAGMVWVNQEPGSGPHAAAGTRASIGILCRATI
jgi:hypothetical protein